MMNEHGRLIIGYKAHILVAVTLVTTSRLVLEVSLPSFISAPTPIRSSLPACHERLRAIRYRPSPLTPLNALRHPISSASPALGSGHI